MNSTETERKLQKLLKKMFQMASSMSASKCSFLQDYCKAKVSFKFQNLLAKKIFSCEKLRSQLWKLLGFILH